MRKCNKLPVVRVSSLQSKYSIRVKQIQKLTQTILNVIANTAMTAKNAVIASPERAKQSSNASSPQFSRFRALVRRVSGDQDSRLKHSGMTGPRNDGGELHIALVNDAQIRKVNKLYHGTDAPTDVLAFETPLFKILHVIAPSVLGELIISVDHAWANSKRFNVSHDEELMRYIVHGTLHLLGERDDQKAKKEKMFQRQELILKHLAPIPKLVSR